jgi:UTP--glucose-1-phosphate uridylyltransferase
MVRDAIILAGGLGTRMLPASLYAPKEALPLIDTPILNHLIWEASKAGVNRVHLVLSKRKMDFLNDFFVRSPFLDYGVREDLPRDSLSMGTNDVEIIPHVQKNARGVADAISVAINRIDGAFLVLLGDMLIMDSHIGPNKSGSECASSASKSLVSTFEETGLPCVGVCPVEEGEVSNYGVVEISEGLAVDIVEKPEISEARSNFVLCGRYIFPEDTAGILGRFPLSEFGEMQSIYLLRYLIENGGLNAVNLEGMEMYDSGDPISWLKSQIDHGLRRDDISKELFEWLEERLSRI